MKTCTAALNYAAQGGGFLYMYGRASKYAYILDTVFYNNTCSSDYSVDNCGAGIYSRNANLTLNTVSLYGNQCNSTSGLGGGMFVWMEGNGKNLPVGVKIKRSQNCPMWVLIRMWL
jgi:hypothetical protein